MNAIVRRYVTPSGREWAASFCRLHGGGCVLMTPLGSDTYSGGGVRAMHVDRVRLEAGDKTWKPDSSTPIAAALGATLSKGERCTGPGRAAVLVPSSSRGLAVSPRTPRRAEGEPC